MLPPVLAAILIASCDSTAAVTPVSAIQGPGNTSPLEGRQVTIEGTVTGDFQADDDESRNLGGFFLQGEPDGDDTTSDGIFVYDGNRSATDVAVGYRVRVRGTVAEHFGETQVQSSDVTIIGNATVPPAAVILPVTTTTNSDGERIADLERFGGDACQLPADPDSKPATQPGAFWRDHAPRRWQAILVHKPQRSGRCRICWRTSMDSRRVKLSSTTVCAPITRAIIFLFEMVTKFRT